MTQLEQLEEQLKNYKRLIEVREMVERLSRNPDFKKLIIEGFCGTEAARYVQQSGDPAHTAEERADALAMAQASGHLLRFLHVNKQMGAVAERQLSELEEAIEEVRAEGGDE